MSKPPKLSLASIVASAAPAPPRLTPPTAEVVHLDPLGARERKGHTLKERAKQMSVYLEPPVYDQLRDLAYAERTKMHALMLEAVDLLFKQRGARSIDQLNRTAER
jgi:hypothetical protein